MIVGMIGVALQGGIVVTQDIDLWIENLGDEAFREAVTAAGGVYIAPLDLRPPLISGPGLDSVDLVVIMTGLASFEEEYKHVRWVSFDSRKLPALSLQRIMASKRATNRPKDIVMMPVLEELSRTLGVLREVNEKESST